MRRVLPALRPATVLLVAACSGGKASDIEEPSPSTAEPEPAALSVPDVVHGLPNMDNLGDDWDNEDPDDDELVAFTITLSEVLPASVCLTLDGSESTRIWHDDVILIDGDSREAELEADATVELKVEFKDFDTDATLTVEEIAEDGEVTESAEIYLRASPLLLNHHLQPAELVVAVETSFYGVNNDAFIQGYADALGDRFEPARGQRYFQDPWMQDEIEFAYGVTPDGQSLDLVIDSIRNRGLDDYPEDVWAGEGFGVNTWGFGYASSQDSFGNLEISPPVDGFPFGRIYYGNSGGFYQPQAAKLFTILEENRLQDPIEIDISWLCVGHVDEFMTFVPDSTAPRGFRFVINDVYAAWEVLEAMDPTTPIPRWAGRQNHDYSTIQELLDDDGLRLHNEDIQLDHLDPIREQMMEELGLTEEEVIRLPGLFESVGSYCGDTNAALIPGMANLIVSDFGDGTHLFLADPFLREDLGDQSTDPMIDAVTSIMPAEAELHFLDDWDIYHLGLGEVHCGSNVLRTPSSADWWTNDLGGSK